MARLDVFVCDRCGKRVINFPDSHGAGDWQSLAFSMAVETKAGGYPQAPHKGLLLCPTCVRSVSEPLAQVAEAAK